MASLKKEKASEAVQLTKKAAQAPLFFVEPHILDAKRHAKATLVPGEDYRFTAASNSAPINGIEFVEAAKYYPIVFSGDDAVMPAVVMGFEQKNSLVDADGKWCANFYIPAYVRQYPFIFFEEPEHERFYLCVDEKSVNFSLEGDKNGAILYNADGTPSALSNRALEFCTAFYQHHLITKNLCADLLKHDLLVQFQTEAKLASGKTFQLNNFKIIDEAKFNALSDEVFADFRKKGWLAFIYFALASNSNWKRLLEFAE